MEIAAGERLPNQAAGLAAVASGRSLCLSADGVRLGFNSDDFDSPGLFFISLGMSESRRLRTQVMKSMQPRRSREWGGDFKFMLHIHCQSFGSSRPGKTGFVGEMQELAPATICRYCDPTREFVSSEKGYLLRKSSINGYGYSRKTAMAALRPLMPITEPPGWVQAPQR